MSEKDIIKNEERTIERGGLAVYSLLILNILIGSGDFEELLRNMLIVLPGLLISWLIFFSQFRDMQVRALVMAVMRLPAWIRFCILVADIHQIFMALSLAALIWYLIYKRFQMNQTIIETIEKLQEAERSKDIFMANASHELRTPLNTICGMSEVILNENLADNVRDEVFDVQVAGRNLQTIVSDILDFSELESGKMVLNEQNYNFASVVNDVLDLAIAQNAEKNLELIVDCDANIPSGMLGDSEKIRRIMTCLVHNAIKFTEQGCVTIRASVRKEVYGVNLCISIIDTGIGMTPEQIEQIFTKFYQADSGKKRKNSGMGIGLAITRKLTNAMQGFISVKSKPNEGSEFQVVIPQKVVDSRPIAVIKNKVGMHFFWYTNQEKYSMGQIRERYTEVFGHMQEQLEIPVSFCRNLPDLKRKMERHVCSHLFISMDEYREEPEYFEALAKQVTILLVMNRKTDPRVGEAFIRIYKPFYILSVVAALNGEYHLQRTDASHRLNQRLTAPTANILVVDDNIMNLKVMEGLLRPYQVQFFAAASGQEALGLLGRQSFDLIFMDHMMPGMDGIETLHQMKNKFGSYVETLPIIALTANATTGAREMFLGEGFRDFIAKPVEVSCLERILKSYLAPTKVIETVERIEPAESRETTEASEEDIPAGGLIDQKLGIQYCGGERKDYIDVLKVFGDYSKTAMPEMERYLADKNWKEYMVQVHSLKSASLGIGAVSLFELAKAQEAAAKEEKELVILKYHEPMMKKYDEVIAEVEKILQEEAE